MRIRFEIEGDVQLDRKLLRFKDGADLSGDVAEEINDQLRGFLRSQFATQGRSASGGWEALKPATIARKARRNQRPEILRATDALRKSLTLKNDTNAVRSSSKDELFFGTSLPYAVHHQHGAPRANVPRRRPVELTNPQRAAIVRTIQKDLIERGFGRG